MITLELDESEAETLLYLLNDIMNKGWEVSPEEAVRLDNVRNKLKESTKEYGF